MEVEFPLGSTRATLVRSPVLGTLRIIANGETHWLQRLTQLSTHLYFGRHRNWRREIAGQEVLVEKTRPAFAAGVRAQAIRIYVNGVVVAASKGV